MWEGGRQKGRHFRGLESGKKQGGLSRNHGIIPSIVLFLRRQWRKNGSEAVEERQKGMRERRLRGSEAARATQCVMRHPRTNSNLAGDDTNSSAEGIRAASSEKQRERSFVFPSPFGGRRTIISIFKSRRTPDWH